MPFAALRTSSENFVRAASSRGLRQTYGLNSVETLVVTFAWARLPSFVPTLLDPSSDTSFVPFVPSGTSPRSELRQNVVPRSSSFVPFASLRYVRNLRCAQNFVGPASPRSELRQNVVPRSSSFVPFASLRYIRNLRCARLQLTYVNPWLNRPDYFFILYFLATFILVRQTPEHS